MFPLKDKIKLPGIAYITIGIVFLNIIIFYLEFFVFNPNDVINSFGLIPGNLSLSHPLSLLNIFSSQFLHGGWFHFLSNMWFLVVFGPNIEKMWGKWKFLSYYFICGLSAVILQLLFTTDPTIPIIGASGAISGILGAYFFYFSHHKIKTLVPLGFIPIFLNIPAGLVLLYWFALQILGGLLPQNVEVGGVAFFAHIGGFVMGVLLGVGTKTRS